MPADRSPAPGTPTRPHLLHGVIDAQWVGYEIECPFDPNDPDRPCRGYEEDLVTDVPGCAVNEWIDSGMADDLAELLNLGFKRQRLDGPLPVSVCWEPADEFWSIEPWNGADRA